MSAQSRRKSARHKAGRRKLRQPRQPIATASVESTREARKSAFIHPFMVDQLAHSDLTQDELELVLVD